MFAVFLMNCFRVQKNLAEKKSSGGLGHPIAKIFDQSYFVVDLF